MSASREHWANTLFAGKPRCTQAGGIPRLCAIFTPLTARALARSDAEYGKAYFRRALAHAALGDYEQVGAQPVPAHGHHAQHSCPCLRAYAAKRAALLRAHRRVGTWGRRPRLTPVWRPRPPGSWRGWRRGSGGKTAHSASSSAASWTDDPRAMIWGSPAGPLEHDTSASPSTPDYLACGWGRSCNTRCTYTWGGGEVSHQGCTYSFAGAPPLGRQRGRWETPQWELRAARARPRPPCLSQGAGL